RPVVADGGSHAGGGGDGQPQPQPQPQPGRQGGLGHVEQAHGDDGPAGHPLVDGAAADCAAAIVADVDLFQPAAGQVGGGDGAEQVGGGDQHGGGEDHGHHSRA